MANALIKTGTGNPVDSMNAIAKLAEQVYADPKNPTAQAAVPEDFKKETKTTGEAMEENNNNLSRAIRGTTDFSRKSDTKYKWIQ